MPDTMLQLGKRIRNERQQRQWTLEQFIRLTIMHPEFKSVLHLAKGDCHRRQRRPFSRFSQNMRN
jgi:hypothetical protein